MGRSKSSCCECVLPEITCNMGDLPNTGTVGQISSKTIFHYDIKNADSAYIVFSNFNPQPTPSGLIYKGRISGNYRFDGSFWCDVILNNDGDAYGSFDVSNYNLIVPGGWGVTVIATNKCGTVECVQSCDSFYYVLVRHSLEGACSNDFNEFNGNVIVPGLHANRGSNFKLEWFVFRSYGTDQQLYDMIPKLKLFSYDINGNLISEEIAGGEVTIKDIYLYNYSQTNKMQKGIYGYKDINRSDLADYYYVGLSDKDKCGTVSTDNLMSQSFITDVRNISLRVPCAYKKTNSNIEIKFNVDSISWVSEFYQVVYNSYYPQYNNTIQLTSRQEYTIEGLTNFNSKFDIPLKCKINALCKGNIGFGGSCDAGWKTVSSWDDIIADQNSVFKASSLQINGFSYDYEPYDYGYTTSIITTCGSLQPITVKYKGINFAWDSYSSPPSKFIYEVEIKSYPQIVISNGGDQSNFYNVFLGLLPFYRKSGNNIQTCQRCTIPSNCFTSKFKIVSDEEFRLLMPINSQYENINLPATWNFATRATTIDGEPIPSKYCGSLKRTFTYTLPPPRYYPNMPTATPIVIQAGEIINEYI